MTGIPQVQPFQQPAQYGQQQQYPPPYQQPQPQYQQPMLQPQNDVASLIGKYETDLARMKKLKREKEKLERKMNDDSPQPRGGRSGQEAGFLSIGEEEQDESAYYEDFELDELKDMLRRVRKGTPEYRIIQDIIEDRELAEEQLDLDELGDELDEFVFHAVKVMDPQDDQWQMADAKGTFDDVESLVSSVRKRFPYATKVKWGVVKKNNRTIESMSNKGFNLQSSQTANMRLVKDQQALFEKDKSLPQQPIMMPQQQQMDIPALIMAMAEQNKSTQQMFMQFLAATKDDSPKESETDKMMKYQQIFMTPQLEMIKAMQPKGGSNIDPMAMVNTMLSGAQKLAGMGGGGGGGGGDGILQMILSSVGPFLQQLQQQMPQQLPHQQQQYPQQNQQQLPPPQQQLQQQPQGQGAPVKSPIVVGLEQRCKKIIQNMLAGKLQLEQVPRYIYRNCAPEEGSVIFQSSMEDFHKLLLGSVNQNDPTMRTFISRPDVRKGVQWIHEEFSRLIRVMTILINQGQQEQANAMIEWTAGILVETNVIGPEAEQLFRERYEISDEDLAPFTTGEDLPAVEEEDDEELPSGGKSAPASKINRGSEKPKSPTRQPSPVVETKKGATITPKKRKKKKKPSFLKR